MITMLRPIVVFCSIAAFFTPLSAQITITAADIGTQLAAGNSLISHLDTTAHTIDIGSPGATSWDYSGLGSHATYTFTSVDPDTTPFAAYFPAATHCLRGVVPGAGTIYSYQELGADLLTPGTGSIGLFSSRTMKHPSELQNELPMTYGSTWSSTTTDSTIITGLPFATVSTQIVEYSVDAYGTLTLPGAGPYQAIRIRTDRRTVSGTSTVRSISYMIVAQNGAAANISAADTLQPDNGTIGAGGVTWNAPIVTGILADAPVPSRFELHQNYPNPFNPSTTIGFDLPAASVVRLTVTDILGRTVATLVDGLRPPGAYREEFDARDLPGGVYFCRLMTADGSLTRKLLLAR